MKTLILFRGLPGSGKSTLAKAVCESVFSADDFFTNENGQYCFDMSMIKDAHQECKNNVEQGMSNGISPIGVANTFTREWEMHDYFSLASKKGYQVHVVIVENRHNGENIHGVPGGVVEAMKLRFEVNL